MVSSSVCVHSFPSCIKSCITSFISWSLFKSACQWACLMLYRPAWSVFEKSYPQSVLPTLWRIYPTEILISNCYYIWRNNTSAPWSSKKAHKKSLRLQTGYQLLYHAYAGCSITSYLSWIIPQSWSTVSADSSLKSHHPCLSLLYFIILLFSLIPGFSGFLCSQNHIL